MKRILLVEDNELNRNMLSRRLMLRGYAVDLAITGQEAIDRALQNPPDLILMDLSLPDIDGWEATRQLRSKGMRLPIIALTAHALQADRDRAMQAGCDDFDTKPVDLKRLLNKIALWTEGELAA